MKHIALALSSIIALSVCSFAADDKKNDADNSGTNARDRNHQTLTPGDQSETPADRELSQKIRQAIMKDKSLTLTAKNIKIITANGAVTLRGPVNNDTEKTRINELAKAAAGQTPVQNQLEVKNNK